MDGRKGRGFSMLSTSQGMEGELLCEGYLLKRRGVAQNRRRWFRLTEQYLTYYDLDGGDVLDKVPRKVISSVERVSAHGRGPAEVSLDCRGAGRGGARANASVQSLFPVGPG